MSVPSTSLAGPAWELMDPDSPEDSGLSTVVARIDAFNADFSDTPITVEAQVFPDEGPMVALFNASGPVPAAKARELAAALIRAAEAAEAVAAK